MALAVVFSDHVTCLTSEVVSSPLFGSAELGQPFDDVASSVLPSVVGLHSINISHGSFVYGIQAVYSLHTGDTITGSAHGTFTQSRVINFNEKEVIFRVAGRVDPTYGHITQLLLYTKDQDVLLKTYGPFGAESECDTPFSFVGAVVGLYGRSGHYINALGANTNAKLLPAGVYARTQMIGGAFGVPFDDHPLLTAGQPMMLNLTINSQGGFVRGIRAVYRLENGSEYISTHGAIDQASAITFRESERIVQVDVDVFSLFVDYIMLSTLDSRGTRRVYGPYGDVPQSNITTLHGTVYGFFGLIGTDHQTAVTGMGGYV